MLLIKNPLSAADPTLRAYCQNVAAGLIGIARIALRGIALRAATEAHANHIASSNGWFGAGNATSGATAAAGYFFRPEPSFSAALSRASTCASTSALRR